LSGSYEKGILTHSKGRLLAYLVWFGKIRCTPSISADVMKIIGYKSPGHWNMDINDLLSEGYIILDKKEGCFKPSEKAKNLLEPLVNLKRVAALNTVASVVILIVGFLIYMLIGQPLFFIWNLLIALYLTVTNFHSVRPFFMLFRKIRRAPLSENTETENQPPTQHI